jgi:hypothetical protein
VLPGTFAAFALAGVYGDVLLDWSRKMNDPSRSSAVWQSRPISPHHARNSATACRRLGTASRFRQMSRCV